MNDGVALLLERMKTHPEEFESNVIGKWSHIINSYKQYLEEEDCKALDKAINSLMQQQFTEKVMEELVNPKKSDNWVDRVMAQKGITSAGATRVGSSVGNAIQNGGSWETISVDPLVQAHIDAYNAVLKKENKEHKTLFGRLWNYL